MNDYRNLIIKGIKEAAPRGQNVKKAFEIQQGKDETPTEWLERLRKNMKQYSGIDPDTIPGQALLRVNFVTHAWPDIKKKLEKMEDWHDRSLNELLREAQKVYVRRDEEKAKIKAKVMVATMRESNFQRNLRPPNATPNRSGPKGKNRTPVQEKSPEYSNACFFLWEGRSLQEKLSPS